jgi:uncharacterized protein YcbK (DUF882 family)
MNFRILLGAPAALAAMLLLPVAGAAQSAVLPGLVGAPAPHPSPKPALGISGSLHIAILTSPTGLSASSPTERPEAVRYRWVPLFGTGTPVIGTPVPSSTLGAPDGPGTWRLDRLAATGDETLGSLTVLAPVPFTAKTGGFLNGYHIGTYPTEGDGRTDEYAPPSGFIEVTPGNQELQLSEHFRLRQFLTKDQFDVWPKYVALDTRLLDKLELVMTELNRMGVRADHYYVMSGYRTPQYNGPGGDGRAALSRHMYGDAADGWVDNDGNGVMDDLNGDGRVDLRDAEIILRAVERVEQKYPGLTGGCGLYNAGPAHGPFVHIDARGNRARW